MSLLKDNRHHQVYDFTTYSNEVNRTSSRTERMPTVAMPSKKLRFLFVSPLSFQYWAKYKRTGPYLTALFSVSCLWNAQKNSFQDLFWTSRLAKELWSSYKQFFGSIAALSPRSKRKNSSISCLSILMKTRVWRVEDKPQWLHTARLHRRWHCNILSKTPEER